MLKGFLVVAYRVTSSRRKFKQTISRIRRFAAKSAVTHFARRFCESSNALTAMSAFSWRPRSVTSICSFNLASRSRSSVPFRAPTFVCPLCPTGRPRCRSARQASDHASPGRRHPRCGNPCRGIRKRLQRPARPGASSNSRRSRRTSPRFIPLGASCCLRSSFTGFTGLAWTWPFSTNQPKNRRRVTKALLIVSRITGEE